ASGSAALDVADGLRVAAQAVAQIDAPVLAEGIDGDAGLEIDLLQVAVGGEDQAPVGAVLVLPEVEAAVGRLPFHRVSPERLAGGSIQRHDGAVLTHDIHHAIDHQRAKGDRKSTRLNSSHT